VVDDLVIVKRRPGSGHHVSKGVHLAHLLACRLMNYKYRGCIVVLSINKSVEPNEE
jgi:hypothetical protein